MYFRELRGAFPTSEDVKAESSRGYLAGYEPSVLAPSSAVQAFVAWSIWRFVVRFAIATKSLLERV